MKKKQYHKLLKRQLKRYLGGTENTLPENFQEFVNAVNSAYRQFDDGRALPDSMELSSIELIQDITGLRQAEEKISRQNVYLATLHEMTVGLMNRLDLKDVLDAILQGAVGMFGASDGFIGLWEQSGKTPKVKASTGSQAGRAYTHLSRDEVIMGQVLLHGEIIILDDYRCQRGRISDIPADLIKTVIVVPLKDRGEVAGVMVLVYRNEPRPFEEEALNALNQFAVVASIALENAQLYAAAQEELAVRKRAEEKLKYLSMHDGLTGLYNRSFFKETMDRLKNGLYAPIGIIICDIDGLKLINDTMGHATGDKILLMTTEILKRNLREGDVISRIGGDEFAILLPNCNARTIGAICDRILEGVKKYHAETDIFPLSLSVGYAVSGDKPVDFDELFKEADNNMYREKLHRSQSTRSAIVQTIMKLLEVRDFIIEGHADRMQDLASTLAMAVGLPEYVISEIRLIAQFHDIGKVGIPDRILLKPGPLTPDETAEMRRHSEIGHRIAQCSADLLPIAEWILRHHEWWNGKGYPLGLKGEEIPLECRIIAIVDAYDAMTNARPYRKPMKPQEAVDELIKYAGIQFDPFLVKKFIQIVKDRFPGIKT